MNYKDLIKNWHSKASEEDYFSKYVFEYLAFIAYLKTQLYDSADSDRRAIQRLKQDEVIKNKYLQRINTSYSLKKDWEHIKHELEDARIGNASQDLNSVEEVKYWNCSKDELNQMSADDKQKIKGLIYSLEDWGNMVEFWNTVRNNLFHGAKNPENARDQFAVKYGYKTLKELMEILLHE